MKSLNQLLAQKLRMQDTYAELCYQRDGYTDFRNYNGSPRMGLINRIFMRYVHNINSLDRLVQLDDMFDKSVYAR